MSDRSRQDRYGGPGTCRLLFPLGWEKPIASQLVRITHDGAIEFETFERIRTWSESTGRTELCRFDLDRDDRDYWSGVKKFLIWLSAGLPRSWRDWWYFAYKELRRLHHDRKRKYNDDILPARIVRWAQGELRREADKSECVDNYRMALTESSTQMRRFRRQEAKGCCGCKSWEALGPDGKIYRLGFNYGH